MLLKERHIQFPRPRGVARRFTESEANCIRRDYLQGSVYRELAERYDATVMTLRAVIHYTGAYTSDLELTVEELLAWDGVEGGERR